ncbi:MAG: lamin tail domain-containing protein [Phycisphaerales bacterium]|nr:MAG: lamin tail domain-containing protein [Phycisphaerales bacterium]
MLETTKIPLFVLILTSLLAACSQAGCPVGDLNLDCQVNSEDLQVLAEQWLAPAEIPADLNSDTEVGMDDFALLASSWHDTGIPLVVNEFMAANNSFVQDPQGEYDDWIEIYNMDDKPIDIGGMYLTDDLEYPKKWRVPYGKGYATTVPGRGYLLIWADEDTTDAGLHASFRIDAGGDELALFDADGSTLIDRIGFSDQTSDVSYGRYPDAGHTLRFFAKPTPGTVNDSGYLGVVADTKFSHDRGFYEAPFSVAITTETEGATIYYTLDGAEPYDTSGRFPTGRVYTGPIPVTRTTCIRAKAIKAGWKPSNIDTHTYLFNASTAIKSLPAVSLVGDERKTFYEPDGVMAIVGGYYGGSGWVSSGAGSYNNVLKRGYERPVSFELIKPEDNSGLQVDCGLRVHGSGWMRPRYRRADGVWNGDAKFSFRLYFRSLYGRSWLEYPLFPFEVERFKSVVLRGGHNDRVNPFIKDELIRRLQVDMGHVSSRGTMANLFINGEYKGYFNPCEHIKDAFCQEWYDSDKDWDVMTMNGIRDGDSASWNEMINYARGHNLANDAYYWELSKKLDITNFADYLILRLWSGDWDWPQNNWSAASERSEEGRWRFFVWDAEGSMFTDRLYTVYFNSLNSQNNANGWLYRALKASRNFKQLFGDRLYRHFYNDGALTEQNIRRHFLELRDVMQGVIPNMDMYVLNTWVPQRPDIFFDACIREDMFTFAGPTFSINGTYQHGGSASSGDALGIVNPRGSGRVYYTLDGSDPGQIGVPIGTSITLVVRGATKHVFVPGRRPIDDAWKGGGPFEESDAWTIHTGDPGGVGYERGSGYENYITADVGELMYNLSTGCYIRIPFTFGSNKSDLTFMTLQIQYDDGFVAYLNGIEVARRNLTGTPRYDSTADTTHSDPEAIVFEHVDVSAHVDDLRYGENILAIHGLNASIASSDFLISAELVAGKAGSGDDTPPGGIEYTGPIALTESVHAKARVLDRGDWSALAEAFFSVGPVAENLRVTEIMYHPQDTNNPDDPNTEFVELKNTGAEALNLNLVKFTNGIDFTFQSTDIAPGEYILVVKDEAAFASKYGPGFNIVGEYTGSLANDGETIELQDAAGQIISNFRYRDGWYDITDGTGFSLTIKDPVNTEPNQWSDKSAWRPSASLGGSPGTDDTGQVPELGDVVINEILAHSHAEASDWIELHNTTDHTINIGGWFLSDDGDNLKKYEIAQGRTIKPGGYVVFTEHLHFGNWSDAGSHVPFALSENGETLYLHSGQDGKLTGYSEQEKFGASETGVAFGRYQKSTGAYNFVAMSLNTPGSANAYPKVGPIVITEIMYHPSGAADAEYVELLNITGMDITLYDYITGEPWKFTDDPDNPGIELLFGTDPPVTVAPGEYILLAKDVSLFKSQFSVPAGTQVFEWGTGKLDNGGEKVQLSLPGDVDAEGVRHYIRVDRVRYSDGSHPDDFASGVDPWPTWADGLGLSLHRRFPQYYGNDPDNWEGLPPSPGTGGSIPEDPDR